MIEPMVKGVDNVLGGSVGGCARHIASGRVFSRHSLWGYVVPGPCNSFQTQRCPLSAPPPSMACLLRLLLGGARVGALAHHPLA